MNGLAIDHDDGKGRERCSHYLPTIDFLSLRMFDESLGRLLLSLILLLALNPA